MTIKRSLQMNIIFLNVVKPFENIQGSPQSFSELLALHDIVVCCECKASKEGALCQWVLYWKQASSSKLVPGQRQEQ